MINSSVCTDKGNVRDNNEDSFLSEPQHGLWLVADGMGGHEAGEVASAIVVDTVSQTTATGSPLASAIQASHHAVLKAVENGTGAEGMGSTVVALRSNGRRYQVAWVGDSRAYLWTRNPEGGQLQQLSTDHSYVQMLLSAGAISEDEIQNHPDRNVITQCIGSLDTEDVKVDVIERNWGTREWVLLCSDGLTDEVSDQQIAQILLSYTNIHEANKQLLRAAMENGGHDNITIQLIESPLNRPQTWWQKMSELWSVKTL